METRFSPRDCRIGTVTQVGNGKELFLNVKIKPAANLSKLEEVLVLVEKQERQATAEDNVRVRAADILAQRLPSVPDKPAVDPKAADPKTAAGIPGLNGAAPAAPPKTETNQQPGTAAKPQVAPARPRLQRIKVRRAHLRPQERPRLARIHPARTAFRTLRRRLNLERPHGPSAPVQKSTGAGALRPPDRIRHPPNPSRNKLIPLERSQNQSNRRHLRPIRSRPPMRVAHNSVPITYTSGEQVEVYRFSIPVTIGVPLLALFVQAFIPLRFPRFAVTSIYRFW